MTGDDFDRFVRDHERMVRALAVAYVRDPGGADDVVQETFLRAWRSIGQLRDFSKAKSWLYSLARNAALDWLRARKRRKTEELTMDVAAPERKEDDRVDRVMNVVDGLREDFRQLVLLRFVEGMSYAEIGAALGMTTGAVGEKLHRVRKMVMERLGL